MGIEPRQMDQSAGFGDALALFRRLSSQTVASSFQVQSRDQFGGQIYNRSNATLANLSTLLGSNAVASGNRSTAVGAFAYAKEDSTVALGVYAQAGGASSIAIGDQVRARAYRCIAIGPLTNVSGIRAIGLGVLAVGSGLDAIAIGTQSEVSGTNGIGIGNSIRVTASGAVGLGRSGIVSGVDAVGIGTSTQITGTGAVGLGQGTGASGNYSIAVGYAANAGARVGSFVFGQAASSSADRQWLVGDGANSYATDIKHFMGANGQALQVETLTELLTVANAAFSDTAIQIPAFAVVLGVSVRVTVSFFGVSTNFTVTGATSGTTFGTNPVAASANSTDKGTAAGAYYNAAAQSIRITPDVAPGHANGRVRVTIHYYEVTPPTS